VLAARTAAKQIKKEKMKTIRKSKNIDKPREKLEKKGISALTNQELVMLILGSGIKGHDVASQSFDIIKMLEIEGCNISFEKLKSISGIGTAKAAQILSSFELTKRYLIKQNMKIKNVDDILMLIDDIRDKKQEHFISLTLNGASTLIKKRLVFKGTVNNSIVHPREVFADALTDRAAGIIFAHNHPADDSEPSEADIKITKQLCEAGNLLGIKVIDHIIVTKDDYFSFESAGLLK